jgi:hypothetical protein
MDMRPDQNDADKRFMIYHQPSLLIDALGNAIQKRAPDLRLAKLPGDDEPATQADMVLIAIPPEDHVDVDALLTPFETIVSISPRIPVVAVLETGDPVAAAQLFERRVTGFITADSSIDLTIAALRFALAGGTFAPPSLLRSAQREPFIAAAAPSMRAETLELASHQETSFTPREIEVLHRLRQGLQNKIIAYELGISESTVKVHLRNVMKKLHASNRTQVAFMLRRLPHLTTNGATSREYSPQ